ncbi:MAG TPA: TonB-dependent receptor [Methylomirabilota bacterium]|nr:TonB-dependent receptor [Methylomirabilota bacterium]
MTRPLGALLVGLAAAFGAGSPAAAQAPDEPTRLEPVVVTATRLEQKAADAPASVTVLTRDDIEHSASQTVDDFLRQVPGFSLFRRASSLVTHPTTQGLSLRGIGPSGTSRALVLFDGVPANDPFGGWVYWARMPMLGIDQIEVVRGGGSSVWGNYALGGVVQIITRRPTERALYFDGSYGLNDTMNFDLLLHDVEGPFRIALEGNYFSTGGYDVVKKSRRGSIDIEADSNHQTFNGRVELVATPEASLFVSGSYFYEARNNGTPLQINHTGTGGGAIGGRLGTLDQGEWRLVAFADTQEFRSTFSTQAQDRNSETLALDQRVPTTSAGGSLSWSRRFGSNIVSAGGDARWVQGETDERVYNAGAFVRTRDAGGQQFIGGIFLQDVYTPIPALELVGGVRGDYWNSYDGTRHDTPPPAGINAGQTFDSLERIIPSGRVAALYHATATTDLRAAAYQGFRVPTLNEQYRVFRVRSDVTVANATLKPEELVGGELGVQQRWGPFEGRITAYWNDVHDLVANVTLTTRLPDCPAGTTCRQRQNLDLARIRGFETELELRPHRDWRFLVSYLFADARVVDAPQQPALEGKRLAQVPEHAVTAIVRFSRPSWFDATLTGRYVGPQYEDDLNTLPLGGYFVLDAMLSRAITKNVELYVAAENILDRVYSTGRTTDGVISIGEPFQFRGGVRLRF